MRLVERPLSSFALDSRRQRSPSTLRRAQLAPLVKHPSALDSRVLRVPWGRTRTTLQASAQTALLDMLVPREPWTWK